MTKTQPFRSFNSFALKNRSIEQQFRKAIESQERVYLPRGRYILNEPIEFDEPGLFLLGEFGKFHASKIPTVILADRNLGGRPTFHRKGFYLSHNDVWMTNEDKPAVLKDCAAVGTGLTVQIEGVTFQTQHEDGCNIQIYNATNPTYIRNCAFGQSFRGLMMVNTFGAIVENCAFQGDFRRSWLQDLDRVKRGWGLYVGNNVTIIQCNWQGGLVGLQIAGTCNQLIGGRIERNIYGLIMGGANLNPDVDPPESFGQLSACSYTTVQGLAMESNLYGILMRAHAGTTMFSSCVTGTNAPQLDNTDGPCEYGINIEYLNPASSISNCAVSGTFRQDAVIGGEFRPSPNIILHNSLKPPQD